MTRPADHPALPPDRVGILLINLGTPDRPDIPSVRRYLRQFLSDRRVIEAPRLLWWFILNGIILPFRPGKSAAAYRTIWQQDGDDSPLRLISRAQAEALAGLFGAGAGADADTADSLRIEWAMCYGRPSVASALDRLQAQGCRRILLAALYPQYAAASTAAAYDACFRHLQTMRWQPAIRTLPPFHDDPAYIAALAESVRTYMTALPPAMEPVERLLVSFHGLPRVNLDKGDPYHCQCQKTARLLREALDYPQDRFGIVFQSRFGRQEWLKPYALPTVIDLARQGVKSVAVITPGFISDCLETLEEIDIGLRETFIAHGGQAFHTVPCLNADPAAIRLLHGLLLRELGGWYTHGASAPAAPTTPATTPTNS